MLDTVATDAVDKLIQAIKDEFASVGLEFSPRDYSSRAELWVYVTSLSHQQQVEDFCRRLEEKQTTQPPVSIFTKTWTGPWPGGETEQEIKRRREDFMRGHNLSLHR